MLRRYCRESGLGQNSSYQVGALGGYRPRSHHVTHPQRLELQSIRPGRAVVDQSDTAVESGP